jgi:hypothetical protein
MSLAKKMGDAHENFLTEILGGRKTRASGSVWKDQMDGRHNRMDVPFAFAWDGKSTLAASVSVSRKMWEKAREQAAGERPLLGLRFYDTERLDVGEDLVVMSAHDFAEMLEEANKLSPVQIFFSSRDPLAEEDELLPRSLVRLPRRTKPIVVMDGRSYQADEIKVKAQGGEPMVASVTIGLQEIDLEGRRVEVYQDNVRRFSNDLEFLTDRKIR